MNPLLILTAVFASLFVIQTIIFSILLRKARRAFAGPPSAGLQAPEEPDAMRLTETESRIMLEIAGSGALGARDLSRRLGLSREHVARTLKKLVENGLLTREGKPYKYRLTDLGERIIKSRDITHASGESS